MENTDSQKILEDLKLQIKEAKNILDILVPLTSNWEMFKLLFDEISVKIHQDYTDLSKAKSLNTKYVNDLEKSKKEIDEFIDESKKTILEVKSIQNTLKDLEKNSKTKAQKVEDFHKAVLDLKKEIEDKKKEINSLFKSLSWLSKKSEDFLSTIRKNKNSSNDILKVLEKIQKQAEKNIEILDWYFKNWKETFNKIQAQSKTIDNFEKLSSDNNKKIQDYFNDLFTPKSSRLAIKDEINSILQKIKSQQETIDQQINISTANRLCNAFQDKVWKLEKELLFWEDRTFRLAFAIIFLNLFLIFFLSPLLKKFFSINFEIWVFQHIWVITPLVILFWFAILEHSRIKKILDEYSFKYISAFSMPAYFELLENKNQNEATKFLIDTINNIYTNPSNKINENSKTTFLDYFMDFVNEFKTMIIKNKINLPEIEFKWKIWDYDIDISKNNK